MAGHLVTDDPQVHERASRVLEYWFDLSSERQFAKDSVQDRAIGERFGGLRDDLLATGAAGWRNHPDTILAAIVVLDQFSRNIQRGTPRAFEADGLAAELTLEAIGKGWEKRYPPEQRVFLYMPLMHAEDAPLQALSVEKFADLGIAENLAFAKDHAQVIADYGRFPSRNAALGRISTPEEADYLSRPDAGW